MFSRYVRKTYRPAMGLLRNRFKPPAFGVSKSKTPSYLMIQKAFLSTNNVPVAQGISGPCQLITGDFQFFTKIEAKNIEHCLGKGHVFVLLFDRDSIAIPANERAMWIRSYFNHHPNLEVRIAYGAPESDCCEEMAGFVEHQLPKHIAVSSVHCSTRYSQQLARNLNVKLSALTDLNELETLIRNIKVSPDKHFDDLIPQFAERITNRFSACIEASQLQKAYESEIETIQSNIVNLNPNHPNEDTFFSRVPWDLGALNKKNLPIIIGSLLHPQEQMAFSNPLNAQVFDFPIYMPKQGWKIPVELNPFLPVISQIIAAESLANPDISDYNAYITVDCGVVAPGSFARRDGLHVDGFIAKSNAYSGKLWGDHTYVISNQQALQTEFYPGPFHLSNIDVNNPEKVLKAFAHQGAFMKYHQANAYEIVRMTVNNVHAVHPNLTDKHLLRTFLKFTFSQRLFNRSGNTINPFFNYRLMYIPRANSRNTQNFTGEIPKGYLDVSLTDIFESNVKPSWLSGLPYDVCKKPEVMIKAQKATAGTILDTSVGDDIVTTNVARKGDYEVSRTDGDRYFLGSDNFHKRYQLKEGEFYTPKSRKLKAYPINESISFVASWGTRQNIPKGGFIIEDENERWGVHPESFAATYKPFNP